MRAMIVLCLSALVAPAWAQPAAKDEASLTVGVYTPQTFFANSPARQAYAASIASALASKTGLKIRGRAFTGGGEFSAQIKAGKVDFAVVDAQYRIQRGFKALAQGTSGGKSSKAMVIVAKDSANISGLKGRTFASVSVGGRDQQFIYNYLLQGQVGPGYFKKGRATRDVQGALSLVKLGKADATFTYSGATAGLKTVFRSRAVPLPMFVQTNTQLPAETVGKIKSAIQGVRVSNPVFGGFGGVGGDKGLGRALKGGIGRPGGEPTLAPVRSKLPPITGYLDPGKPDPALPPIADDLVVPELPGDLF